MRLMIPKEIRDLRKIYEPYEEGCHLREDAPPEAVEAKRKYSEWFRREYELRSEY